VPRSADSRPNQARPTPEAPGARRVLGTDIAGWRSGHHGRDQAGWTRAELSAMPSGHPTGSVRPGARALAPRRRGTHDAMAGICPSRALVRGQGLAAAALRSKRHRETPAASRTRCCLAPVRPYGAVDMTGGVCRRLWKTGRAVRASEGGLAGGWSGRPSRGPHGSLRAQSVDALSKVAEGSHRRDRTAARAPCGRSKPGDYQYPRPAWPIARARTCSSAADRLVLASLTEHGRSTSAGRMAASGRESGDYAPTGRSSFGVLSDPRDSERLLIDAGKPVLACPRAAARTQLVRNPSIIRSTAAESVAARLRGKLRMRGGGKQRKSLADTGTASGSARAVLLELAHGAGEVARVAELLLASREGDSDLAKRMRSRAPCWPRSLGNQERLRSELERARRWTLTTWSATHATRGRRFLRPLPLT